jgi:hypothetical protein
MVKVRTLAALVVAVSVGLALVAGPGRAQDKAAEAAKPAPPKKMVINGMSFGVLRVPEVAVWSCPGGQQGGCNLVAKVKHGTEVMRYESEKARGLKWYRIQADGVDGWILSTFLKRPGT